VGASFPRDKRECVCAQTLLKQKDNAKGAKPTRASFLPQANFLSSARAGIHHAASQESKLQPIEITEILYPANGPDPDPSHIITGL
jgi:hypothetical protein